MMIKKCFITSLYRSPSQTSDELETFLTKFEQLIDSIYSLDPYLFIILGDFNARSSAW